MKHFNWRCFLLLLACQSLTLPASSQDEIQPLAEGRRTWTMTTEDGTETLEGQVVGLKQASVQIELVNGEKRTVALENLVPGDRKAALVDRVGSGVVMLSTKDVFGQPVGFGTGFVIHPSGLILTNYHVIAGAASVGVSFREGEDETDAKVMSVDREHDIAFLRVDQLPETVHVIEILSNQLPALGTSVWTLGHPDGLKNTAGWGQISAVRTTDQMPANIRQSLGAPAESRWLQTNAVLARGSSGGPLLNEFGQALGINSFVLSPQLGFAIHISHARDAYGQATKGQPLSLPLPPGENEDALAWLSPEIAPLVKEYSDAFRNLQREAAGLTQSQAMQSVAGIHETYRDKFLSLARENASDWAGLQAMVYAAQSCDGEEDADALQEICDLALKHQKEQQHLKALVQAIARTQSGTARDFCRKVAETSPHEIVRMSACFRLGVNLLQWLQYPDSIELAKVQGFRDELEQLCTQLESSAKELSDEVAKQQGLALAIGLRRKLQEITLGLPAPEIDGVDAEGANFKLSDYRGKVVLLDFFADWCPHCKRMYPGERAMVENLKDRPFALLGVHCESERVLEKLVNDKTVTWRSWADGEDGPIVANWRVDGFPTMILVDHDGVIRWRSGGAPEEKELNELIEQLLVEAER